MLCRSNALEPWGVVAEDVRDGVPLRHRIAKCRPGHEVFGNNGRRKGSALLGKVSLNQ